MKTQYKNILRHTTNIKTTSGEGLQPQSLYFKSKMFFNFMSVKKSTYHNRLGPERVWPVAVHSTSVNMCVFVFIFCNAFSLWNDGEYLNTLVLDKLVLDKLVLEVLNSTKSSMFLQNFRRYISVFE